MKTSLELFEVGCGPGWYKLIRPVLDACTAEGVKITQIKEKYGTLRIYTGSASDKIYSLIDAAERQSEFTCETCGEPGKLREYGWVYTSCDLHVRTNEVPNES